MPHMGAPAVHPYAVEILGSVVELASPLLGAHQHRNLALAVAAAVELREHHGFPITPEAVAAGVRSTRWPGRLERVQKRGLEWILDVAHNPAGAWALRAGLRDALGPDEARPMALVFACLRDKPLAELAQILFPLFDEVIFPPIQSPRATPVEELLAAARSTGTPARVAVSVAAALDLASTNRPGPVVEWVGRDFSPGTSVAESPGPLGPEVCVSTNRPESVAEGVGRDFSPGTPVAESQGPLGPEVCVSTNRPESVAAALDLAATNRPGSVAEGVGRDFSPGTPVAESQGPLGPEVCLSQSSSVNPPSPGIGPEGARVIVISGSVYLVGEARGLLMSNNEHKQEAPA
jgi:hypothetical protein